MALPFTEDELEILKGHYPSLATTLGVSDTYLKNIAKGKTEANTELRKKHLKKLQDTVVFFTPIKN